MIGNNIMELNHATMARAVQYYLDNVLLKKSGEVSVSAVSAAPNGTFRVVLTEPKSTEEPGR